MLKNLLAGGCLLLVVCSAASGEIFIGSRQAGMGGTGVASAVGLNAVAYNPAGMLQGPSGEFLLSLGAASQGLDQITQSLSTFSDPAQYMIDNYANKLDANGSISGILGFNFNHLGLSLIIPGAAAALTKPANSLVGSVGALGNGALILTFGQSFSIPGVPIGTLAVGANIKSVYGTYGALTIATNPVAGATTTATQLNAQGNCIGYDVGAKASFEIPFVTDFSVGLAMRDLSETIKYTPKVRTDTYTYTTPGGAPTLTKGTETSLPQQEATLPTTTVYGCAGTVPGVGLKFAADVESISAGTGILAGSSDTITHLGIEYPLLFNAILLRAGTVSGQSISRTTVGAKINFPLLTLEIANIIDNKNSLNTSYVIDAGIAF